MYLTWGFGGTHGRSWHRRTENFGTFRNEGFRPSASLRWRHNCSWAVGLMVSGVWMMSRKLYCYLAYIFDRRVWLARQSVGTYNGSWDDSCNLRGDGRWQWGTISFSFRMAFGIRVMSTWDDIILKKKSQIPSKSKQLECRGGCGLAGYITAHFVWHQYSCHAPVH